MTLSCVVETASHTPMARRPAVGNHCRRSKRQGTAKAEVVERLLRAEAAPARTARIPNGVAPGATASCTTIASGRALGIPVWRYGVVARAVAIRAPLVHADGHVVEAVPVGTFRAHFFERRIHSV